MRIIRIVIEISSLVSVPYISGIQRVVREIVTRMISKRTCDETQFILVAYSMRTLSFYQIPTEKFLECYLTGQIKSSELMSGKLFSFDELGYGDVFFDIDSVWNNRMRRSFLLPILKKQGVSIAVHIYDIIPVLYPQYCDEETTLRFMDYLGAHLLYSDLIIANTESTLRDVRALSLEIDRTPIQDVCVPLGADMPRTNAEEMKNRCTDPRVLGLKDAKYLLMVGTIEPRKNHAFVIDIYEQTLQSEGFTLVIAGRPGWNVDDLMRRIQKTDRTDDRFLYFSHANDATIDYLYEHAFFTIFPSQYEGFGLPIIESFLHKIPVLASDIPVLREVGSSYCDYFALNDKAELHRILLQYRDNPSAYSCKKNELEQYVPFTWDQSEEMMWNALQLLRANK